MRAPVLGRPLLRAASAHDELTNAPHEIRAAIRIHWLEALVVVLVRVDDKFCAGVVERLPHVLHRWASAVSDGIHLRAMPESHHAEARVCCDVGSLPLLLWRPGGVRDVVVQHKDVPPAEVEAIVAIE